MFSDNASLRKNECSKLFQTVKFYIDAHKTYVVQILLQTIYFSILLVISLSAILLSSVILLCAILILPLAILLLSNLHSVATQLFNWKGGTERVHPSSSKAGLQLKANYSIMCKYLQ